MPWKIDSAGNMVVQEGNPVWIYEDGKEAGFNAEFALKRIGELKQEAKDNRLKAAEANNQLKIVADAGIEDLEKFIKEAQKALDIVKDLKDGDLVKAGEVEKIRAKYEEQAEAKVKKVKEALEAQVNEANDKLKNKDLAIRKLLVKGAFDASEFIREQTVLFPDMAYMYFGGQFEVVEQGEDLKVYALDKSGERMLSLKNPGQYADPEEAIEMMVMDHPQRDKILIRGAKGSGALGGQDNKGTKINNPWKRETRNLTEQMRIARENPELAKRLKIEAGITV